METSMNQTCCACLSSDRRIVVLDDVLEKQYFLRLIWEISVSENNVPVFLCYECDALLRRFTKFKLQAQKSYTTLQKYNEKTAPSIFKTNLSVYKQYSLNLPSNEDTGQCDLDVKYEREAATCEVLKTECEENNMIANIKEEFSNGSEDINFSDDDDKTLIELSRNLIQNTALEIKAEEDCYKEKELTEQEIVEERKRLALAEEYVNGLFRCERCIITFPNADDLADHISMKHEPGRPWKCAWCECTFRSPVAFNYHTSKHTRRYACVACAAVGASKRGAVRHYNVTHVAGPNIDYGNAPFYDFDKNAFKDQVQLEKNGKNSCDKSEEKPQFACEFCEKRFRWKTSLRKHVETHRIETGQKRRPYCEPCRVSFTTTANLQKHVKTSSKHQIQLKLRKLKEEPTDLSQNNREAAVQQITSAVNSRRQLFGCAQCDRKFQWRGNLLRHQHSHAAKANGELVCKPCDRTFSSIATYKQHMKISRKHVSENEFKYMCSDCGKRFPNKTRLKDHVDWEHLKNYVHKCPVCQKVFKSHTSLYLHKQVVHKKSDPEHLCDHCGKPFPNRAKLRSHVIALHTSESPYACNTCNARFSWHSCLSRHVRRVHRGAAGVVGASGGREG